MSTQNILTFQQKATLGNATATVCQPIAWEEILKHPSARFTPKSVRHYLFQIVEKLNPHFGLWMDGDKMCKLRVRRKGRDTNQHVDVTLSTWRAKQLFPWLVRACWVEGGKKKKLSRNVVDIFLSSRNRNELYQEAHVPLPLSQRSPVVEWLKLQLALPEECCSLKFGGLNARKMVYESFLEEMPYPNDWSAKAISQELYNCLPSARPTKGKRLRLKGVAVMYLPSRERCQMVLENWYMMYGNNVQLLF